MDNKIIRANPELSVKALLVIGPTCVGKGLFGEWLGSSGFYWIEPSAFIKHHIPIDLPILARLSATEEFFQKNGANFVAQKLEDELKSISNTYKLVVITGCRQLVERDIITRYFPTEVVSIHSSDRIRYDRALARGRPDAVSITYEDFLRATAWEYAIGLGQLIYESDQIILNDNSLSHFYNQVIAVKNKIVGKNI